MLKGCFFWVFIVNFEHIQGNIQRSNVFIDSFEQVFACWVKRFSDIIYFEHIQNNMQGVTPHKN